MFLRVILA